MASPVYEPLEFSDLRGWGLDEHELALAAFAKTLAALESDSSGRSFHADLAHHCHVAAEMIDGAGRLGVSREDARRFFEARFTPHRVIHDASDGLLTGYYEPVLKGSRRRSDTFRVPLLRRPLDLVTIVDDALRGAEDVTLTHGRQTSDGVEAYATREEIECGALDSHDLEFLYLADPVDAFFLHVQGSGLIELDDGERIRVGYDGKNGHPYTSVGQYIVGLGEMTAEAATLDTIKAWLQADAERGRRALWQNKSYIFFRELGPASSTATLGVRDIPLTTDRSLAVDAGCHELGLPVYVDARSLVNSRTGPSGLARLMVAQDVGSAIRGPERGDIFYGVGDDAGQLAGTTKHRGNFFVFLPRPIAEAARA